MILVKDSRGAFECEVDESESGEEMVVAQQAGLRRGVPERVGSGRTPYVT